MLRDAFFNRFYEIAKADKNVILLTVDMGAWALEKFQRDLPDQFINVGIAEQDAINVATGLALGGKKVYCFGIASFILQRCFDQLKNNVNDMYLPVTIIGSGGGKAYWWDGPTHCIDYDLDLVRLLDRFDVITPATDEEARFACDSSYKSNNPVYIGLGRI